MKIGIWGRARTGKTTYLAMLYQYVLSQAAWSIEAVDDLSRNFVLGLRERIYQHKSFPERTDKAHEYAYRLRHHQEAETVELRFFDAPGELFQDFYDPQKRSKPSTLNVRPMHQSSEAHYVQTEMTPQQAFDHLRKCDGVMIFIEPQDEQASNMLATHTYLYHLLEAMRNANGETRLGKPVLALCIVKVDARDELWRRSYEFEALSARCLRYERQPCSNCPIYQQLSTAFMDYQLPGLIRDAGMIRCFMLSAIGRTDEQPNVGHDRPWEAKPIQGMKMVGLHSQPPDWLVKPITNIPVERTFLPSSINDINHIRPMNLLSPIMWFLEQRRHSRDNEKVLP
ncbi:MAG: hypothetical protein NZ750_14145 [Anaerolineae bacterium]|nr:hypothetical protein [Anaerolineae bacterium]MDW8173743.1 hypothetical protein [Anaerolineae bacterium]